MDESDQSGPSDDPYDGLQAGPSVVRSFARFYNKTQRIIDIFWVNYNGQHVRYCTLKTSGWFDVNTFVGHPWLFRDHQSGERLLTLPDRRFVYFPTPPRTSRPSRRVVVIGIPVVTLQMRCVQILRPLFEICSESDVDDLEIPAMVRAGLKRSIITAITYRHAQAQQLPALPPLQPQQNGNGQQQGQPPPVV